ncbi:hypothetical protein ACIQVK_53705 [Streptomyces sp. NPDC090493]|uniref:DUF6841 family protein n=1 Tax=Streptomyces sp. NPDC090493 TaxID=3365964 RepID=UPI003817A5F5
MVTTSSRPDLDEWHVEINEWFFQDYLPNWVAAVKSGDDSSFIARYWGAPLWIGGDAGSTGLLATSEEVIAWFDASSSHLKSSGYTHTKVLDARSMTFNKNAGFIDVMWSRRRGDESEIERMAVHFLIALTADGLRVVAIEAALTETDSLDDVWPVRRNSEEK